MKDFLQQYTITLTTKGPVFIGSGEEIKKNQAVFRAKPSANRNKSSVVDNVYLFHPKKLMEWAEENGKTEALFEILSDPNGDLSLLFSHFKKNDKYPSSYFLKVDLGVEMKKSSNIQLFIKDGYGKPYVPGSSLKGALRTAILQKIISNQSPEITSFQKNFQDDLRRGRVEKDTLLEAAAFHDLDRNGSKEEDLINDFMAGFRVSDSLPLRCDETGSDLQVYRKIDVSKNKENPMNVYRECIKEGVKIQFTLTIDHSLCEHSLLSQIDETFILDAISQSYAHDQDSFHKYCPQGKNLDLTTGAFLYLGGGAGYISKTVTYDLLTSAEVEQNSSVLGSSHTYKKTPVNGQYKSFGLCQVDVKRK